MMLRNGTYLGRSHMTELIDWAEYGRVDPVGRHKRMFRRWLNEERGHIPVIDRVTYPETGQDCRLSRRGWKLPMPAHKSGKLQVDFRQKKIPTAQYFS